jgi:hypothetical protein
MAENINFMKMYNTVLTVSLTKNYYIFVFQIFSVAALVINTNHENRNRKSDKGYHF